VPPSPCPGQRPTLTHYATENEHLPVAQFEDPNMDDVGDFEDDSPYPEVRSAVANTDDVDMPCSTIRAWVIGMIWAILIPGLNQFFFFRWPNITITGLVAQLVSFPMGRAWARFMPRVKIFGVSLNPGPFTVKEHVLLTVMATVTNGSAYATDIIAVQRVYYSMSTSDAVFDLLSDHDP
jgi:OPT family oligopeptide transporter